MICRVCGGSFEGSELVAAFDTIPYGEGAVEQITGMCCPNCGSQQIFEAGCCKECGQEVPENEIEDGLCRLCVEEVGETLEWMWGMLSTAQRCWVIHHIDALES